MEEAKIHESTVEKEKTEVQKVLEEKNKDKVISAWGRERRVLRGVRTLLPNDKCHCGSGKKYKKCHQYDDYFPKEEEKSNESKD